MVATLINVALVLVGSGVGLLFRNLISQRLMTTLTHALGLCVLGIGLGNLLGGQDTLCLVVCLAAGAGLGTAARLEQRLEGVGDRLRAHLGGGAGDGRFTQGFVSASLLFCVGAMAITGSLEAGLRGNYEILLSKGVIDGVSAVSFAATMGMGVACSALPLLVYQGGLTLLAGWVGPYLPEEVVTEMSAAGGALIVAIALNMLELGKTRIQVGNLLPAMFLPIIYLPLADWLGEVL